MGSSEATTRRALLKRLLLHLCRSFFVNNLTCNVLKKRLQHRCASVNIAKLLRAPILKNICQQLLLVLQAHYLLPKFNQHQVKMSHYSLIPLFPFMSFIAAKAISKIHFSKQAIWNIRDIVMQLFPMKKEKYNQYTTPV